MSDWVDLIDRVMGDLASNVPGLEVATQHRYTPQDPEKLLADGQRHLAVWPDPNGETYEPLAMDEFHATMSLIVLVWEPSPTEGPRGKRDEDAMQTFLQLQEDTAARFMVQANMQFVSGAGTKWDDIQPGNTSFVPVPGEVRWFALGFTARRVVEPPSS